MATISLSSRTATSISVYITDLDTSYSKNDRYIEWWFNYNSAGTQDISGSISSTNPITFINLSPNTSYPFGARIYYTTYDGGPYTSVALTDQWFSTLAASRPSYFYWSSYGTGYNPQNRTTVNGKIALYRPYATAWNAFRSNIISMLVYKGIIANAASFSTYSNYFPEVSTATSKILAADYIKARACINAMGGNMSYTVVQKVTQYTENYFYYLQYYLNAIT